MVYAFAALDPNDLKITSGNEWEDFENRKYCIDKTNFRYKVKKKKICLKRIGFYERLVSNSKSGDIKVMISMGGWTDSAGDKYSKLISSGTTRRK